eukprot:5810792-Alexandrium_andersonii.AAC.1
MADKKRRATHMDELERLGRHRLHPQPPGAPELPHRGSEASGVDARRTPERMVPGAGHCARA